MRKTLSLALLAVLSASVSACDKSLAYGDPHAVIVVTPQERWSPIQDSVYAVLSPDVFTLRPERTFRITHQVPEGVEWLRLQKFKEVVSVGSVEEPWVAEALATLDDTITYTVPGIVEAEDVWARGQVVTLVLTDAGAEEPSQVFPLLHPVYEALEQRFRQGAFERMFVSGAKESLVDSLRQHAGFTLTLPEVYRWSVTDSMYLFRNDNPDPSELIREFGVTWRTPIPEGMETDSLIDWKESVSAEFYNYGQMVQRETVRARRLVMGNMEINEIRGAWSNPPDSRWPAAGPFIFWSVACPERDRLYYLDGWLYAPGKDKWEYILQLETIMGSFRCGSAAE
jgi:hypothetical protein